MLLHPKIESTMRNVVLPNKPAFLRVQDDSMEESLGNKIKVALLESP